MLIGGRNLSEVSRLPLARSRDFFDGLQLTGQRGQVADKLVSEISARLQFLINVGLDYLSLDRSAETLSGGEAQRIRLASQIGSGLTGVMYVLDEPSIGLHQRDNDRLIGTLKHLRKDPNRTMVVIDPRRTETAKQADIHLQLKSGTDAFLMSAMIAIILRDNLHDRAFIDAHCTGFDQVERAFRDIPIADYVARADVPLAQVEAVARRFATASSACVRIDLGIQHTINTTLNGYLEKLLYLITGNFGIKGGNNLHSSLIPILGHTDERKAHIQRSVYHQMFPIAGILPPNILPDEILKAGEQRIRAIVVDSCNPILTWPDTPAMTQAFESLELLVVVDVAMTETARMAHYVLPAASQFEKWEFTGFNLEFPKNGFHLRHPLFAPLGESLPEAEIYTRLLEKMRAIPRQFPLLSTVARYEPASAQHLGYVAALFATLMRQKKLQPYAASVLYRTLGKTLPNQAASAAFLLPLAIQFAVEQPKAVQQAGHRGNRLTLGSVLFESILASRSGMVFSQHEYRDVWQLVKTKDKRVHLAIPEMLSELAALPMQQSVTSPEFPFVLAAGERRSYNANQIYRNPAWRKVDPHGALRIHPQDAADLGIADGGKAYCSTAQGRLEVVAEYDDGMRRGMVSLPHGYGLSYNGAAAVGPALNRIISAKDCDPLSRTPFHKYVAVRVQAAVISHVAEEATLTQTSVSA